MTCVSGATSAMSAATCAARSACRGSCSSSKRATGNIRGTATLGRQRRQRPGPAPASYVEPTNPTTTVRLAIPPLLPDANVRAPRHSPTGRPRERSRPPPLADWVTGALAGAALGFKAAARR